MYLKIKALMVLKLLINSFKCNIIIVYNNTKRVDFLYITHIE